MVMVIHTISDDVLIFASEVIKQERLKSPSEYEVRFEFFMYNVRENTFHSAFIFKYYILLSKRVS